MFRVYRSDDVVGVQLCAAAKNVVAVAAGASDGLGFGDNAKAALMTRGLAELGRLGEAFGADPRTYAGLAGLGDLVATCTSRHSRNRAAGEQIAKGVAPDEIEARLGMAVEGLTTAPTLRTARRSSATSTCRSPRPSAPSSRACRSPRRCSGCCSACRRASTTRRAPAPEPSIVHRRVTVARPATLSRRRPTRAGGAP